MYRVFIVDDEKRVREGLLRNIHWNDMQMEVSGLYANGREALKALPQHQPAILISDVKMPVMDGITLCNEVRKAYPHIRFIFISGYDDKEYLKAAISSEAVDYVFKPVNIGEMEGILTRLQARLDEEMERGKQLREMQVRLTESMPLLREKFLLNLLAKPPSPQDLHKQCTFLQLPILGYPAYQIAALSLDDAEVFFDRHSEVEIQVLSLGILTACRDALSAFGRGLAVARNAKEYVLLLCLQAPSGDEAVADFLVALKNRVTESYSVSLTIGLSKPYTDLENSGKNYRLALDATKQKLLKGKNQIIHFDVMEDDYTPFEYAPALFSSLQQALKVGDPRAAAAIASPLFEKIRKQKAIQLNTIRNLCLQLILICGNFMEEAKTTPFSVAAQEEYFDLILKLDTLDDMESTVLRCIEATCHAIARQKESRCHSAIEQVKQIIAGEYASPLTIQQLADQVFLAPQYLCILFKQETGLTINDYVTAVRMDRAKEMLKNRKYKLYDICERVGYMDPSYFTKIFKRSTGMTPSEYREQA